MIIFYMLDLYFWTLAPGYVHIIIIIYTIQALHGVWVITTYFSVNDDHCCFIAEGFIYLFIFLKNKQKMTFIYFPRFFFLLEVTHPHMYNDMKLAFKENYCLDTLANFATTKVNWCNVNNLHDSEHLGGILILSSKRLGVVFHPLYQEAHNK